MYEDRTQEVITEEMLEEFGADVRTDIGSLAYNACAKTGSELEDVYTDLEIQEDNALPDTMDILHLIRYAAERGIIYKDATQAIVKGVFLQPMAIGDRLMCQDYVYEITSEVEGETNTYLLTCEEEGTGPNAVLGELEAVDYIDNYQGGEIVEVSVLGTDDEDEDVFRGRVIDSFSALGFGGNKADYRLYIDALTGVGGCKPKRRDADSPWINIYVINSDFGVPSNELINQVQDLVDPEVSHGEGDGKAAINQMVQICPAAGVTIDVEADLQLDTGYEVEAIQPQAVDKIESYLLSMRKAWEDGEQQEQVVRLARIEAALISIEGVIDVTSLTINGVTSNQNVTWTDVPVLGNVTIY